MATYTNKSGGMIILPDGNDIKAGDSADISADVVNNVGVSQMIYCGMLEAEKKAGKAKADDK